jgi:CheY-like chemotaxis protein
MAWTILNNNRVDLILLDVEMPNVSGLAFIEILKKLSTYYYIPVIFVTSHATPEVIRKAKEEGAKDFIVKPFTARTLADKVDGFFAFFKEPEGKEALIQKLHLFDEACKRGQSGQIDAIAEELLKIHCNDLDLDARVMEICRLAQQLDYKAAIAKTAQLFEQFTAR